MPSLLPQFTAHRGKSTIITFWTYIYKLTNYITFVSPKPARAMEPASLFVK